MRPRMHLQERTENNRAGNTGPKSDAELIRLSSIWCRLVRLSYPQNFLERNLIDRPLFPWSWGGGVSGLAT